MPSLLAKAVWRRGSNVRPEQQAGRLWGQGECQHLFEKFGRAGSRDRMVATETTCRGSLLSSTRPWVRLTAFDGGWAQFRGREETDELGAAGPDSRLPPFPPSGAPEASLPLPGNCLLLPLCSNTLPSSVPWPSLPSPPSDGGLHIPVSTR